MDTITDMLSTFFVAQKRRPTRQNESKNNQQTQTTPPVIEAELEDSKSTHTDKSADKHTHSEKEMSKKIKFNDVF